jgi:hypothetical protein
MSWIPNQAIRSAVGLSFEIVKVLQQHQVARRNRQEEAVLIAHGTAYFGQLAF